MVASINDNQSDDLIDCPIEGTSFLRHFSFDYLTMGKQEKPKCKLLLDSCGRCYRSTCSRDRFPFVSNQNPILPSVDSSTKSLFSIIDNYEDVLFCMRCPKMEKIREIFCAHALNHSLKSRKLVVKNNARAEKSGLSDSLRDQGFHRARILVLLPTRESARRTVHQMLRLMPKGSTVSHRKRFERDFGPQDGQLESNKSKGKKPPDYEEWFAANCDDRFRIGIAISKKSVKLYTAFADSDIIIASPLGLETLMDDKDDKSVDMQCITTSIEILIIDQSEMLFMQNWAAVQGIVSRINQRPLKPSMLSPARIRHAYLAGFASRFRQTLIFSSVSHPVINSLSAKCENFQGINFFLPTPHYQGMFPTYLPDKYRIPGLKCPSSEKADNFIEEASTALDNFNLSLITFGVAGSAGSVTSNPLLRLSLHNVDNAEDDSSDEDTVSPISKKFRSAEGGAVIVKSNISAYELSDKGGRAVPLARLAAFKQRLLPRLRRGIDQRVLIYVPDYYDSEELRKLLREESLSFCAVHEYIPDNEAERYRNLFDQGRIRIMLLSERYYFFRRRKIRGARNFIFYGPPTFPWFVSELLATCKEAPASAINASGDALTAGTPDPSTANTCNVTILYFPPWESHQISMITGSVDV